MKTEGRYFLEKKRCEILMLAVVLMWYCCWQNKLFYKFITTIKLNMRGRERHQNKGDKHSFER